MPASDRPRRRAAALALAFAACAPAAACSPRVLQVVDPCGDAAGGSCQGVPSDPLFRGLIGWWQFDDGASSPTVHDSSGRGNDGMLVDLDPSRPDVWVPGQVGTSLELRGVGYVLVPHSDSIDEITDQVTVAAWIYLEGSITTADLYGTAISREIRDTLNQHYHISINNTEQPNLFVETPGGANHITAISPVSRFTWIHLAGIYDGTSVRLYVDGAQVVSLSVTGGGPFASDTTPLVIGANANGSVGVTERFPGRIDEIMLYKRALGADEIGRLHAGPPY